ncbi:MAG: hypothetical protein LC118_14475 [Dehalococcoidia bacterium]|nr:hypothetical protein [Dehalococcoidia bacterium]
MEDAEPGDEVTAHYSWALTRSRHVRFDRGMETGSLAAAALDDGGQDGH